MGGYRQLPVTPYQPSSGESPLDAYVRIAQLKGMFQQQQLQGAELQKFQTENQLSQLNLQDEQKWRSVMSDPSWDGTPQDLLKRGLQAGVGPKSYMTMQQGMVDFKKKMADLDEVTLKNHAAQSDEYRGRILSIVNSNASPDQKQAMWDKEITAEEQAGTIQPGTVSRSYPGDDQATTWANHFALGSTLAKEAIENKAAEARASQAKTAADRLTLETPGIQADNTIKQANAGVAPEMAQLNVQGKKTEIAKNRAETAKAQAETQNIAQAPIFAVDPTTNERVMTTREEAAAKGYTNPVSVKEGDVSKETEARAMINDVQLNKSRYLAAMQRVYSEPVSFAQKNAMRSLTPENLGISLGHVGGINVGFELPDVLKKMSDARDWNVLSSAQKQAMIGYYSTLASVPAAQKALTNIGRANKEMMDLELRTIPTPLMDQESLTIGLDRFQGNIDQTARKTVRMPGMPSTKDIRNTYEPQPQPQQNGTTHQGFPQFIATPKQGASIMDLLK